MKYHGYEIKKEFADLGESRKSLNCIYNIFKNGKWRAVALTLSTAMQFIDSGENPNYL